MPAELFSTARARLTEAIVAAAGVGLLAGTGGIAVAAADPVAPAEPSVPFQIDGVTPAPAPQTILGQFAQVDPSGSFNTLVDLLGNSPQPPMVGQTPPPPGAAPGTDPWTLSQLLAPQNYRMPTADQASPYALAPNSNPSPFARIDAWKGVHALTHGSIGRMPGDQLGQPMPGTAAPAGSNLPPGLEQFYVDPAAVPPASPPADPLVPQPLPPS